MSKKCNKKYLQTKFFPNRAKKVIKGTKKVRNGYRQPETVFVPQMFVPENGQSWQRVNSLLFQVSRALALTRT